MVKFVENLVYIVASVAQLNLKTEESQCNIDNYFFLYIYCKRKLAHWLSQLLIRVGKLIYPYLIVV